MPLPRIPRPRPFPPGPTGIPIDEADFPIRLAPQAGLGGISGPVLIDIGADPAEANITRGGVQVPSLPIDHDVLIDIIDDLPPRPLLKVVSQSVEAGRAVERGTLVNLVLAEPFDLPINLVGGVLEQLHGRKMGQVFEEFVADQPSIRKLLAERGSPEDLTATDRDTLVGVLGQRGINISPDDDDAIAGAFVGLQTAQLFGSG
jgi:hypothetical protein